jgi:predicted ATP-dependent endonuclease of OLD family
LRISFVEITNFRKLKATRIDLEKKTTIFVGANNSGKTSAMVALRYFLLAPERLALRDITITNWRKINEVGQAWERDKACDIDLNALLPTLDVWLNVPLIEIHHVVHLLPTLDWQGGNLGVRLAYRIEDVDQLRSHYLTERKAAKSVISKMPDGTQMPLDVWPTSLTAFLERTFRAHLVLGAYALDPTLLKEPVKGVAMPQALRQSALPLQAKPFEKLIKIDEIAAQRDFADAGEGRQAAPGEAVSRKFKRRLSDQLRSYYDRHLDPLKTPGVEDYDALGALQTAERSFDKKLEAGFASAFQELEDLGYPGIANPKLKITTQLRATDGLRHGTAVQYQVADPIGDGAATLRLPEDYSGLGYQNLIAMVFMLMSYRDEWMRVGKARKETRDGDREQFELLHLVLVEEPEAHLHAQVQQVFINKAYDLLRKHHKLGLDEKLCTQLVVSTHSSHVAHEVDFGTLRYFRRRPAARKGETPTTTVANLSTMFGEANDTQRFVKRYLKATHCDLFFADGIIFVEGQAERILVPHFIRNHFPQLSARYVTLIDLGGSHAHRFRELVDVLGLVTLVISDLDATTQKTITRADGVQTTVNSAARPQFGVGQKTSNPVLKDWHPRKGSIDDLMNLTKEDRQLTGNDGYKLHVTYQVPIPWTNPDKSMTSVIPRTFEDALIFENAALLSDLEDSKTSSKISNIVSSSLSGEELQDALFALLKTAEKAEFAIDCLMMKDSKLLVAPAYIREGLAWFEKEVSLEIAASEPEAEIR